jgi:UDP-2-acetamido-3-amino-2,3-dideoxy-glucuronate N-acetyltransferase
MSAFIHPQALCESTNIGDRTRVWAFAHILPGARIGADSNICDGVFVENDVVIGDRVTIKCGVQIWDGITLESDVFVGPNATFTNDLYPRSKQYPETFGRTLVQARASIGANATILPGLTIGSGAMIGAGSVVTRDVPQNAIVMGNPARITGYVDTPAQSTRVVPGGGGPDKSQVKVRGVRIERLTKALDMRGSLVASEGLPFVPQRFFSVFDVPSTETRGSHAHHLCEQYLICLRGGVSAIVDDGFRREEIRLDSPDLALYMPPMIWGTQYRYSSDAVLLVLASLPYENDDYIRDYEEFLQLSRR